VIAGDKIESRKSRLLQHTIACHKNKQAEN